MWRKIEILNENTQILHVKCYKLSVNPLDLLIFSAIIYIAFANICLPYLTVKKERKGMEFLTYDANAMNTQSKLTKKRGFVNGR